MEFSGKKILISVLICIFVFTAFNEIVGAAKIEEKLEEKITTADKGEMLNVLIHFDHKPNLISGMENEDTVKTMKNNAFSIQDKVIEKIQTEISEDKFVVNKQFWLVNFISVNVERDLIKEISKMKEVKKLYSSVELNIPEPEKVEATDQIWEHVESTKAVQFWEQGFQGQEITVAVLDTGIDPDHPEFNNELSYWAEFDNQGNIISEDPDEAYDSAGHGSHTSGTVYGRNIGDNNIGMAPEATMAHGLVLPEGGGTLESVIGGLEWAAENGFDVVNLSLGAQGQHEILAEAADYLLEAGVLLIASIGNSGPENTSAPGNTPSACGIGAYDAGGEIASFSSGGIVEYPGYDYDEYSRIKPDLSGPGVEVYSVQPGGGYQVMSGTSMSAPHIAGAAALIKSADPEMGALELREIILKSVGGHHDLGWSDESKEKDTRFGWGRINVMKALEELDQVQGPGSDIKGTVVSSENEEGIDGARIEFAGPINKVIATDENGEYSLTLPEGVYEITITKNGYSEFVQEEFEVIGEREYSEDFMLELLPEGTLKGTIVDGYTKEPIDVNTEIISPVEENIEVEEGKFATSLKGEYYNLQFEKEGYFDTVKENVRVVSEQTTEIEVEMSYGEDNVIITVFDSEQNEPLTEAQVRATKNEETIEKVETDENGVAKLSLAEGEYSLEISKTGYLEENEVITLEYGSVVEKTVELENNTGTLEGTITDNTTDEPLEEAVVTTEDSNMAVTDEEGNYVLEEIEAGEHIIMVQSEGYSEQQATVEIEKDTSTNQDFNLKPLNYIFYEDFSDDNFSDVWDLRGDDINWHRSDRKSLFGEFSAWHGDPETGLYPPEQDVMMITSEFIEIPEEGNIEFSSFIWPDIEEGFDSFSIIVQFEDGTTTEVLNYDGSQQTWLKIFEDASQLRGQKVKLGFGFSSDESVQLEGTYIDGISVTQEEKDPGTVSGIVTDQDGNPLEDTPITILEDTEENKIKKTSQTVTDSEGYYSMEVPDGGWTLEANGAPDYHIGEKHFYVASGEETEQNFELEENSPPDKVENLHITTEGDSFVDLAWDNVTEDLDHYLVYRSINGEDYNKLAVTEKNEFTAEDLQNGHTYYFKVAACDELGKESELTEAVTGNPVNETPVITGFDISPKSVYRGAPVDVEAEIANPGQGLLEIVLKAVVNKKVVREWDLEDIEEGEFGTSVKTVDENGDPLGANFHDFVLEVTSADDRTTISDPVKILLMSSLPESLSFLVDNNPFDPTEESQRIDYSVPSRGEVEISIYSLENKLIRTLNQGEKEPGPHEVYWDGRNDSGEMVLNGAYIIKVKFTDENGETTVIEKHSVVMK